MDKKGRKQRLDTEDQAMYLSDEISSCSDEERKEESALEERKD